MSKTRITLNALTFVLFTLALGVFAQAQATRTWVSGVGDDVNPCSRTAPCKTWAGAISKTAAGGEIDALDPGGFGTLTVTKSITVDGTTGQGWGSTLASGTQGFVINDSLSGSPGSIVVQLRNLSINGAGTTLGTNGINYVSAHTLHVENVRIQRFSGDGIRMQNSIVGRLFVRNVDISECTSDGIEIAGTSASANAVNIDRLSVIRCGNGLRVNNRADVFVSNSTLSANNANLGSAGILVDSAVAGGVKVHAENCQINFNAVGVQPNAGNTIRLSNVHMMNNGNALNFNGGTIGSFGNNKIAGNVGGEAFGSLSDIIQQ